MRFEFNLHLSSWHIAKIRLFLVWLSFKPVLKWWRSKESDHHRFKRFEVKSGFSAPKVPTFQFAFCYPPAWWWGLKGRWYFAYRHSFRSGCPGNFWMYWKTWTDPVAMDKLEGSIWDG